MPDPMPSMPPVATPAAQLGDHIQIRHFTPRHTTPLPNLAGQTLTVTHASPGLLSVDDAAGRTYFLDAPLSKPLEVVYGITLLHPWHLLAQHFGDVLRLDVLGEGAATLLCVSEDGAGGAFVPVGHLDADGAATITAQFDGAVEQALRVAAFGMGWEWAVCSGGLLPVRATVRVTLPEGDEQVVPGHARQGSLALARAMRLALEVGAA